MQHFKGVSPINAVSYSEYKSELGYRVKENELQPGIYLARLAIDPYVVDIFNKKPYALDYPVELSGIRKFDEIAVRGSQHWPIVSRLIDLFDARSPSRVVMKPLSPETGQPLRGQTMTVPLHEDSTIALVNHRATPEVTTLGYLLPFPEELDISLSV